ncbi:hypothetical protein HW49_09340 [Porphyromonadaceae bacterium COT-184 OH4590]|nr:hypothetical protein HW49_09340 [Porphyromonadaceae bacterium COT-184 OH4590]
MDKTIVPSYKDLMMPLLQSAADGKEHSVKEAVAGIAETMKLSEEALQVLHSSGRQTLFYNRLGWAKSGLIDAGCLEATGYGRFRITEQGQEMLKQNAIPTVDQSPEEAMDNQYEEFNQRLADELLDKIKSNSSEFFEQLVIDLLMKMGYGVKGMVTRPTKDGGIDGIIEEDPLGFGHIYTQAKRWKESTVSEREMTDFINALTNHKAQKGVLVTTSKISKQARELAQKSDKNIVLIDGEKLVEYMIEYSLGITAYKTYKLQSIDEDYFNQ